MSLLAFLPQFVSPSDPLIPRLALLGSICVALNTLVDVIAVLGADRRQRDIVSFPYWSEAVVAGGA